MHNEVAKWVWLSVRDDTCAAGSCTREAVVGLWAGAV